MTLFRKEVIEESELKNYGQIRTVLTEKHEMILYGIFLMFIISIFFTTQFDYGRKVKIKGYIHPSSGVVKVYSPSDGYIRSKLFLEAIDVKYGDALVEIESYTSILSGRDDYREYISILKKQLGYIELKRSQENESNKLKIDSIISSIESNLKELENVTKQIEIEREKEKLVIDRNKKYRDVFSKGYVSNEKIIENELDELNVTKTIVELIEKKDIIESQNVSLRQQIDIIKVENIQNLNSIDMEYSKKVLEILDLESKEGTKINSKVNGRVSDINFEVGQEVKKNDYLMSILPDGTKLEVTFIVPSNAYSSVSVGDKVNVKISAFPYEKFGVLEAVITTKSDTISLPSEVKLPFGTNEGFYRVIASLERDYLTFNKKKYLIKPGMLVDSDIVVESKKISDWLLSPFHDAISRSKN